MANHGLRKPRKANWIAGAIKHPGGLHESLGIPQGQKIPKGKIAAAAGRGGKVGRQARLAETLAKMRG
jgi:hypothetical protein